MAQAQGLCWAPWPVLTGPGVLPRPGEGRGGSPQWEGSHRGTWRHRCALYVSSSDNLRASVSVSRGCPGWHRVSALPSGSSCPREVPSAPSLSRAGPRFTPTPSPAHITRPPSPLRIPPWRSPGSEVTGLLVGVGGPDSRTRWRLRTESSAAGWAGVVSVKASLSLRCPALPRRRLRQPPRRLVCGPASVARRVNAFLVVCSARPRR